MPRPPTGSFDLDAARSLLTRTPRTLDAWLRDLDDAWTTCDEGPQTWDARGVLGHLIEGERHDWIPRVRHLLEHGDAIAFPPFDRFAQFRGAPRSLPQLLDDFAMTRATSLRELDALALTPEHLLRTGRHPEFGVVTLSQHLATWVVHDLTHITQIARVMAKRYADAVGPWSAYLGVLRRDHA